MDDGRGRARKALFQHKHELETGRTSSVNQELIAWDHQGQVLHGDGHRKNGKYDVTSLASKIIAFLDLAGHERYLKTTCMGLTAHLPEYSCLVVCLSSFLPFFSH